MLEDCPSLEELSLNICTHEKLHKRQLTVEDFRCRSTKQGESEGGGENQFVVAPLLKNLLLFGLWVMEDEVVKVIYGVTFPGMAQLIEYETQGYTLGSWQPFVNALIPGRLRADWIRRLRRRNCLLSTPSTSRHRPKISSMANDGTFRNRL